MKRLVFFLVFVSVSFSLYYTPPLANVSSQNGIVADELKDSFNPEHAKMERIYPGWGKNLSVNASMALAGLTLLIDNATTSGESVRVIVEEGAEMGHILRKHSSTLYCDKNFFDTYGDTLTDCDFDGDGCSEYEEETEIIPRVIITFIFRDINETVEPPTEQVCHYAVCFKKSSTNTVQIPETIEAAMENSSGNETLTVILNGSTTFMYVLDNRTPGGLSCISRPDVVSKTIEFIENRTYLVEGKNKLIFTDAPILNEQWFRNNRFDNVVVSQSRLYKASIFMNTEKEMEFALFAFNMTNNSFGVYEIKSVPINDSTNFVGIVNITPVILDESTQTYAFLYQFNFSYEGLGENSLELNIKDFFGREDSVSQEILSRQLSYNSNKTELGDVFDPETTRRSVYVPMDTLQVVEIGLGMLGILIILLLAYQTKR